ncbi:hypothetical protein Cni_G14212 [Canna indica]|uniref:hAT-like transposase RNase-H fold domain-containing protein n=1 Tax=Canna indica TaxID=4628 RepID=A0AAQ3KE94_9LILI|nr:hypothetical protein Cni_G14212 [Canna indica]
MATRMKRKYDNYWANINNVNIMLFVAILLDPRFKLKSVDIIINKSYDAQNAKMLKEKLRKILSSMYDSYGASIVSSTVVQASKQARGEKNDTKSKVRTYYIREILKKQKISQGSGEAKTELDRLVEALICGQDWFRSSSKSIFIEHVLAELESAEIESSCDTTGHAIIKIDD